MNRQQPRTATAGPAPAVTVGTLILALLLTLVPGVRIAEAAPDAGLEARFVELINSERASAGLPSLRVADDLIGVGRRHAVRMAEREDLHHNPNLGSDVSGWDKVGENVGKGPDIDRIHAAFMASEGHRRNVLDPDWVEVGVGVEVVDGGLWVTELFRLPSGAAAASPQPEPEPPAEPAPADDTAETASATEAPAADAGTEAPAADTPPADTPPVREVADVPLPVDRITLVLARLEAADDGHPLAARAATH